MCKFADGYPNFKSAKISPHRSTLLVKADGPALSTGGSLTAGGLVHHPGAIRATRADRAGGSIPRMGPSRLAGSYSFPASCIYV